MGDGGYQIVEGCLHLCRDTCIDMVAVHVCSAVRFVCSGFSAGQACWNGNILYRTVLGCRWDGSVRGFGL